MLRNVKIYGFQERVLIYFSWVSKSPSLTPLTLQQLWLNAKGVMPKHWIFFVGLVITLRVDARLCLSDAIPEYERKNATCLKKRPTSVSSAFERKSTIFSMEYALLEQKKVFGPNFRRCFAFSTAGNRRWP